MAKLYRPLINSILPAFTGDTIVVPFGLNAAVGPLDFVGLTMQMRVAATNSVKFADLRSTTVEHDLKTDKWQATFKLTAEQLAQLKVKSFYVVQIAFVNSQQQIGYYSDVSSIKYTSQPIFGIRYLTANNNLHRATYTGFYEQTEDINEKVYSYRFNLYDAANALIETSGDLIHNYQNASSQTLVEDQWTPQTNLINNKWYFVEYQVTTINNLQLVSPKYRIIQSEGFNIPEGVELSAILNSENAYVDLNIITNSLVNNTYLIKRSTDLKEWNTLGEVELNTSTNLNIWKDFTIEHGVTYYYALQMKNQYEIYSNLLYNKEGPITCAFEHMFLFDGEKQLKIAYNPKVGSFKTTLQENKMDTIGGQFPYFFRNGNIKYKEFPISGLLSLISDDEGLFMPREVQKVAKRTCTPQNQADIGVIISEADTQLTDKNIYRERQFKLAALEWLNNGKPKLFKSSTEGNYIVRLMNISLAPNETLGRMLHTFNSTAYEIAEYNSAALNNYGFWGKKVVRNLQQEQNKLIIEAMFLNDVLSTGSYVFNQPIYYLSFENQYFNNLVLQLTDVLGNHTIIDIRNSTGSYNVYIETPLEKVTYVKGIIDANAQMIYGSYSVQETTEQTAVRNIIVQDMARQYIGATNIYNNIVEQDGELKYVYFIRLIERPVVELYTNDFGNLYFDVDLTQPFAKNNSFDIYKIGNEYVYDSEFMALRNGVAPNYIINLDGQKIDLKGGSEVLSGRYEIKDYGATSQIEIGTGVMADIVYQVITPVADNTNSVSYVEEINESGGTTIYINSSNYTNTSGTIEI